MARAVYDSNVLSAVKRVLASRAAQVRDMGWDSLIGLLVAGVALVFASFPLRWGIDGLRATYLGGMEGTVTLATCDYFNGRGAGWDCYGSFRSADGRTSIDRVLLEPRLDHDPRNAAGTALVEARVSSATASVGHRVDDPQWQAALIAGTFGLFVSAYLVWMSWRFKREPYSRRSPLPPRRRRRKAPR